MNELIFTAKPDRRGKIQIPPAIREALGIEEGDLVLLEIRVKRIV